MYFDTAPVILISGYLLLSIDRPCQIFCNILHVYLWESNNLPYAKLFFLFLVFRTEKMHIQIEFLGLYLQRNNSYNTESIKSKTTNYYLLSTLPLKLNRRF